MSEKRRAYLELLAPLVRENYRDISQGREEMEFAICPLTIPRPCLQTERDAQPRYCGRVLHGGAAPEDFDIILSGKQAKLFATGPAALGCAGA